MNLPSIAALLDTVPMMKDASKSGNLAVLRSLLGPAFRGLIQQRGKSESATVMPVHYGAHFDWQYLRDRPQLAKLYEAAKAGQWNATTDLDWSINVDPDDETRPLVPHDFSPASRLASWGRMTKREQNRQQLALAAWFLSQFLHGEQGAPEADRAALRADSPEVRRARPARVSGRPIRPRADRAGSDRGPLTYFIAILATNSSTHAPTRATPKL